MRTGNYMTADRMIALTNAADNIVQCYSKLRKEALSYMQGATDGMISLDTFQEILNRNWPDIDDLALIRVEKKYFETHKVRNDKNRDAQRFRRETASEQRLFADDLRALDFSNDPNPFPSPTSLPGTGASSHAERGVQSDNRELHELHVELVAAFGSGTFINTDQAMMLLQVEQPTIDALVNNDYLRASTIKGRYLISDI